jgi:S-adenosylmethionine decarboxylase proenzyme
VSRKSKRIAKHVILELWDAQNANSAATIRNALGEACKSGRLELDQVFIHRFSPYGVSGVALIAEAHITIHTWPEYSFVAVDIYSSKPGANITKVAEVIKAAFSPCQVNQIEIDRGLPGSHRRTC